jgi:hypothetical protein
MTTHHQISLESEQHFHGRLPTHHLGFLLADLPVAVRCAVSMALRNRSKAPGKQPDWLKRASDLRFTGHDGNGTAHLHFELPSLNEAVSELYQQPLLIDSDRPEGNLSGLDLLMAVLRDIDAGRVDSNAFDPQLLHQIARFKRFFRSSPFSGFRISGSEPEAGEIRVTAATMKNSLRLYGRTPMPQRSRIVGQLDGLEASTQRFSLVLDSGERVPGVFPEEMSDRLQQLWRTRVLVVGTSVFRASGNLLRIEAESIEDGVTAASLFSKAPTASNAKLDVSRLRKPQGARSGMAAIMGRWPGDETEEEIERALERIG